MADIRAQDQLALASVKAIYDAAEQAKSDASRAQTAADEAEGHAQTALTNASTAQTAAENAQAAADRSLTQLSIIEDVAGTLDWIQKNGTFTATTDTTVQEGTVYFVYNSSTQDYEPVVNPTGNPRSQGYYVLDVSSSQSEYIMAHLAVTSRGLWVLPNGMGTATDAQYAPNYKALLSSSGLLIYDGSGNLVSTFGESISFSSSRNQRIGGTNNYIEFNATTGAISIVGANITFGSNKNLNDVLTDVDVSVTQTSTGANITVNGDTVSIANGAQGERGGLTLGITTAPSSYTTTTGGFTPTYRIALSTVKTQSGASDVQVGDTLLYSYYEYPVGYVDASYVYTGARKSIRGATGAGTYSYVRYSANADGSDFTSTPTSDTLYVGFYSGTSSTAPTTASSYTWSKYVGDNGNDGTSVTVSSIKYAVSTTESQPADSSFTYTSVPTVAEGNWLWTLTTFSDGSKAYAKAKQGKAGTNGTSYYTYVRYSANSNGSGMVTTPTSSTKYIGVYSGTSSTVPSYTAFTWSKYVGEDGGQGEAGTSSYTFVRYSANSDGSSMTTSPQSTSKYIGIYVGTSSTAPTSASSYTWSQYRGNDGTSVTISEIKYAVSTTESQPNDSSFTYTSVPTVAEGSWLWTRTTYSDSSKLYTKSKQGKSGTNGTSVTVTKIEYGTSSSASTSPSSWSTTAPTSLTKGTWLWIKTTYSDSSTATAKNYIGTDGANGTTFTPSVDSNGNISWTNDGGKTNPTTQNIKGPQGEAGDDGKMLYATSSTASDTTAKVATLTSGTLTLESGSVVAVTFANGNEATTPTLNVSSTGAKTVKSYTGEVLTPNEYTWTAGACLMFVYDGTYWRMSDEGSASGLEAAFTELGTTQESLGELTTTVQGQQETVEGISTTVGEHTEALASQASDISNLQNGQTTINNNITNVHTDIVKLDKRTKVIESAVVIDPDEPSVTVISNNSSIKITDARVVIKSDGNSVSWADSESFNATRGVFQEIRPRTISVSGSNVTLTGNLALIARSNGHVSMKKVSN